MGHKNDAIENIRTEINTLLSGKCQKEGIFGVFIHYRREGKRIFELTGEQGFFFNFFFPMTFVGNYPHTHYEDVAVYIDGKSGGFAYKVINRSKDKET